MSGTKVVFTVAQDMFGSKIKKGHKYTGYKLFGNWVKYRTYTLRAATIEKVAKSVVKPKAPTASDYKNFADLCFEVAVRYRDNWESVISGKKFDEGDWNGLQAGHGVSRQYWASRHNPLNCHAITSGENYQMSLGNPKTIAKYWAYVVREYGQDEADALLEAKPEPIKKSIGYLLEDCAKCYCFLDRELISWNKTHSIKRSPVEVIKWRCEKLPQTKADGINKVLNALTENTTNVSEFAILVRRTDVSGCRSNS